MWSSFVKLVSICFVFHLSAIDLVTVTTICCYGAALVSVTPGWQRDVSLVSVASCWRHHVALVSLTPQHDVFLVSMASCWRHHVALVSVTPGWESMTFFSFLWHHVDVITLLLLLWHQTDVILFFSLLLMSSPCCISFFFFPSTYVQEAILDAFSYQNRIPQWNVVVSLVSYFNKGAFSVSGVKGSWSTFAELPRCSCCFGWRIKLMWLFHVHVVHLCDLFLEIPVLLSNVSLSLLCRKRDIKIYFILMSPSLSLSLSLSLSGKKKMTKKQQQKRGIPKLCAS